MPKTNPTNFTHDIVEKLKSYTTTVSMGQIGKVKEISDGVARLTGLSQVAYSEIVEFTNGIRGVAINLEKDSVGVIILGNFLDIKEGDEARGTGQLLSIGVSDALVGRVVDPLGNAIDGKSSVKAKKYYPIEKIAPGVTAREPVNVSMATGLKAIDSMTAIGRGQRQLIIGDRGTGKTAIVLDTIINQKNTDVICIYVAIGQKASRIAQTVDMLAKAGAMNHTIVVSAAASEPASLQWLAPYSGCAIGEYFMDQGKDVLIVYDDLTKHAWAYRQISLILKRPSGREAYPGDVFYLHSRLLERACRLNKDNGGGSLTALPIIETQAGDVSAYIPTNVISITDGQIFLESDLFYAGVRPAINVGISVSRVGGAAQTKATKQVAGKLRLDLAQYRELAAFSQFASDLDPITKQQIDRGSRMIELLKQKQFQPMPMEEQVVVLFTGTQGYLDDIPVSRISEFEEKYLSHMKTAQKKILSEIKKEKKISDELREQLVKVITEFKKSF